MFVDKIKGIMYNLYMKLIDRSWCKGLSRLATPCGFLCTEKSVYNGFCANWSCMRDRHDEFIIDPDVRELLSIWELKQ